MFRSRIIGSILVGLVLVAAIGTVACSGQNANPANGGVQNTNQQGDANAEAVVSGCGSTAKATSSSGWLFKSTATAVAQSGPCGHSKKHREKKVAPEPKPAPKPVVRRTVPAPTPTEPLPLMEFKWRGSEEGLQKLAETTFGQGEKCCETEAVVTPPSAEVPPTAKREEMRPPAKPKKSHCGFLGLGRCDGKSGRSR